MEHIEYKKIASRIRMDVIEEVHSAGSGHPGGSLSAADIVTALYFGEMNIDPKNPQMKGRDKFVLSKGHAAPVQYAALAEKGYFPKEELTTLRKLGFAVCVGMAIANKIDNDPGRIYTLLGDGELQEGLIWEAAMASAHYKLDNLCVIVDWNGLQIDGRNDDVMTVSPVDEKFKAFGFNVLTIDGHSFEQIFEAFKQARECKGKPTAIIAKTHKGRGVSFMEDQAGWHGKAPDDQQAQQAISELEEAEKQAGGDR